MQIKATFSLDGKYLISGSESGNVVIWTTKPKANGFMSYFRKLGRGSKITNSGYESFDCTGNTDVAVTVAVFAPSRSVLLYVQNNIHIVTTYNNNKSNSNSSHVAIDQSTPSTNALPDRISIKSNPQQPFPLPRRQQSSAPMLDDIHSRVIVAADYNGVITVYTRLS